MEAATGKCEPRLRGGSSGTNDKAPAAASEKGTAAAAAGQFDRASDDDAFCASALTGYDASAL